MNLDYLNSIIKAWEEGKRIQVKTYNRNEKYTYRWEDTPNFHPDGYGLGMLNDPTKVRVKPGVEIKEVALCKDDLPMPSVVRLLSNGSEYQVLTKTTSGIYIACTVCIQLYTWEELMKSTAQYRYGNSDWLYFKKTITVEE